MPVLKVQKAKQFHKVPSFEFKTLEVHELLSPNSKTQSLCSLKGCFMTNNFTKTLLSWAAILNLPDIRGQLRVKVSACSVQNAQLLHLSNVSVCRLSKLSVCKMAECAELCRPKGPSCRANATSNLLIPIEDLVDCRSVEKQRLEFKKSWNKGPAMYQIIKTISAFANDFYNDNGGYIVIGVEESEKNANLDAVDQIVLPPFGINPKDIERIQKEISGACKKLIKPSYSPILSPEVLEGKDVLVIWAQASDDRPHTARGAKEGDYHYYIRKGPETTKANDKEIKSLLESSCKIPFDDRMARLGN